MTDKAIKIMNALTLEPQVSAAIITASLAAISAMWLYWCRQRRERESINKAVMAEVQRLIKLVKSHEKWLSERIAAGDYKHPLIPFSSDVYDKQVANIGVLDGSLVADIVKFYGYLKFLNALQKLRRQYKKDEFSDFIKIYIGSLREFVKTYETVFDDSFKKYLKQ